MTTTTSDETVNLTIISNSNNTDTTELCYIASLANSGGIYYNRTSKTDQGKTVISFGSLKPASNYSFFVKSSVKGSCSLESSTACDHQSFTSFSGSVTTREAGQRSAMKRIPSSDSFMLCVFEKAAFWQT